MEHSDQQDHQYTEFDAYENDYYANNQYEQDHGWANHAIEDSHHHDDPTLGEQANNNDNVEANHTITSSYHCRLCPEAFDSNNGLHKHIQSGYTNSSTKEKTTSNDSTKEEAYYIKLNDQFIHSNASNISAKGYGFCGWRYATVEASLSQNRPVTSICLDTGCTASLVDRNFLKEHLPTAEVKKMASPMKVRGLGSGSHAAGDYVELELFLPTTDGRTAVIR